MTRELQEILSSGEITGMQLNTSAASASVPVKGQVMKWQGVWQGNQIYRLADVVIDDKWTMIANKPTSDRAAPQPIGDADWVARDTISPSGSFTTETSAANTLFIGQRYEFPEVPAFIVRDTSVFLPSASVGFNCEIWAIYNPFTSDQRTLNVLPPFDIGIEDTEQWLDLPVVNEFVEAGTTIDYVMVIRSSTGFLTFTYEWLYLSSNGDPSSGQIYHQRGNNTDQIRVHEEDSGAVDRTSDLDKVHAGSIITMESTGYIWEVLDVYKIGDVYTFIVDPGAASQNDLSDFEFTYFGELAIPYSVEHNIFQGYDNIYGYFGTAYTSASKWINNNGYGLDIKIQATTSSEDWDVVASGV